MIRLQVTEKGYADKCLFDQFELELKSGELLCLLGPSGCGKTTLLNMIAGLDRRYSGSLEHTAKLGAEMSLGYMFQQPRLLPWRTLRQNLELVIDASEKDRIEPLLTQLGLLEYADSYPNRLSQGMARRVALARCLIIDPQLILMDEPFVSLDPPTADQMRQMVQQLRDQRRHASILFVTHDIREAVVLADRILVLGGSPTRILHQWQAEREPKMRDWDYIAEQEQLLLSHYPNAIAAPMPGPDVCLAAVQERQAD